MSTDEVMTVAVVATAAVAVGLVVVVVGLMLIGVFVKDGPTSADARLSRDLARLEQQTGALREQLRSDSWDAHVELVRAACVAVAEQERQGRES